MVTKAQIVELLKTNDRAIARALLVLNQRQTADEQRQEGTKYLNGQGFRPCHARMGTSMAKFFAARGYLTAKQTNYWRVPQKDGKMRIEIYAGQLLEIANAKAAKAKPVGDLGNLMEERMVIQEQLDSGSLSDQQQERAWDRLQQIAEAVEEYQRCEYKTNRDMAMA